VKHMYFDQEKIVPSKVVCIGRNYVEHIEELGNEIPENMVIFNKPNSAITDTLHYFGSDTRFEGEISTLTKITVNGVVKFSGTYVNEDSTTIKEVNNTLKYVDVNFTLAPDDVLYIEYTTYAQSYLYLGYRNGYNNCYFRNYVSWVRVEPEDDHVPLPG